MKTKIFYLTMSLVMALWLMLTFTMVAQADTSHPAAPTGLEAIGDNTQVWLDWNDNSEPDLAGYNVYRSTTSGGTYSQIGSTVVSDYNDTGLVNGVTYYYVVTAFNTSSNESIYSDEVSATPHNPHYVYTPSAANVSPIGGDPAGDSFNLTIEVSWNPPTGYWVETEMFVTTAESPYTFSFNPSQFYLNEGNSYTQVVEVNVYAPGSSSDGSRTVKARTIDRSGQPNVGQSSGCIVDITVSPPPNNPPYTPSSPSPADDATGVSVNADLSWTGGDPDPGDTVTYDVYLGTSMPPPLVSAAQAATTYDPGTMSYDTHYYWKVVATDNHGASTDGPLWDFTTGSSPNNPPNPPSSPSPSDGAIGVSINANLSWTGGDPDPGDTVTYDVYFDTTNPPITLVSDDQMTTTYDPPGTMGYDIQYFWQVVATDNHSASTNGPVWDFTTETATFVLNPPTNLRATAVSSSQIDLSWQDNSDNEDGFKIERRTGAESYTEIATVGFDVETYSDTGLGSTYHYQVRAYKDVVNSAYSNEASATTLEEEYACFIATAAYGSYLDSHVETLRDFRDSYMVTNPVGSALVSAYYKVSPPVAEFIDDHPALKPIARVGLLPAVAMSTVAINTTSAQKMAIVGSLLLVSALAVIWMRRRAVRGKL